MAVNEIRNTTPLQATAQGRERNAAQPAQLLPPNPTPAPVAATAALTPAQQAALLINQTLQNLAFELPSPQDTTAIEAINPLLTAIDSTQGLTPAQQAALQINDTLLNVGRTTPLPADALLLDETNPLVEATGVTAELTPSQQAAALVNASLRELSSEPPALTVVEGTVTATATVGVTQPPNPLLAEVTPVRGAPAAATLTAEALAVAAGPSPIGTATPPAAATPTPTPATTVSPAATTTAVPTPTAVTTTAPRDSTPFAFAVYEIKDQNPAPGEPKPTRRDVQPSVPPGRVRPVDRLILQREWERRRESGQREPPPEDMPVAERSIRQVISQANADLLANGLPLRLVLGRSNEGYNLDIYDCSYDDMCRLAKEVPLDLKELATLLDNIQHESGIIINLKT